MDRSKTSAQVHPRPLTFLVTGSSSYWAQQLPAASSAPWGYICLEKTNKHHHSFRKNVGMWVMMGIIHAWNRPICYDQASSHLQIPLYPHDFRINLNTILHFRRLSPLSLKLVEASPALAIDGPRFNNMNFRILKSRYCTTYNTYYIYIYTYIYRPCFWGYYLAWALHRPYIW